MASPSRSHTLDDQIEHLYENNEFDSPDIDILQSESHVAVNSTSVEESQEIPIHPGTGGRPPRNPKERTARSACWQYFTKLPKKNRDDPNEIQYARCNYCKKEMRSSSKKSGTFSLLYHGKMCLEKKAKERMTDRSQHRLSYEALRPEEGGGSNLIISQFIEAEIRRILVQMIIEDELPFRFVEKPGFIRFVKKLEPRFRMPSRMTIMRDCVKMFLCEKEKLKTFIHKSSSRICLTTDTWTSIQNINYMCITGHFIDTEFVLHKKVLSFVKIVGHKGSDIAHDVEQGLGECSIDRVFAITVDNASANDVAIELLKKKLTKRIEITSLSPPVILDNEFMHVRCTTHILNLIVSDGLKEHNIAILRVREAVKYVKASPARLESFREISKREGILSREFLVLDVPTRWNSTYKMLEVACKYKASFSYLSENDLSYQRNFGDLGPPTQTDWDTILIFAKFLQVFYEATLEMSGIIYPTANLYVKMISAIWMSLQSSINSPESIVMDMGLKMMVKYDKYWGDQEKINKFLFVVIVLDPRYKLRALESWWKATQSSDKALKLVTTLRDIIYRLYDYYVAHNTANDSQKEVEGVARASTSHVDYKTLNKSNFFTQWVDENVNTGDGLNEFDKYILEPHEAFIPTFDLLGWWKANRGRYPILAQMAREVLAIPTSTVASESTFSMGGRVLDSFRSSLAPKTVQALICTQDWCKSPIGVVDYLDETFEDSESLKIDEEINNHKLMVDAISNGE